MYMQTTGAWRIPPYDFRKDFHSIARAAIVRWLPDAAKLSFEIVNDVDAIAVDETDEVDIDTQSKAWQFAKDLKRNLKTVHDDLPLGILPFDHPEDQQFAWNRDSAVARAEGLVSDIIGDEADTKPVDVYRAVILGTENGAKEWHRRGPTTKPSPMRRTA